MIKDRNTVFEILNLQEGKTGVTSIPLLVAFHGNVAATCRETGLSELTIAKYRFDVDCERHIIYNGRLMTHKSHSAVIYSKRGIPAMDRNK